MIHVYAVASTPVDTSATRGLDGVPVQALSVGPLTVVMSEHGEAPAASTDAVLLHAAVVETVSRCGAAVLPARFEAPFADEVALRRSVTASEPQLHAALTRVRGCAEIGLRVLAPERVTALRGSGGADYMRSRLRETKERDRVVEALHGTLTRHARASTRRPPADGRLLLDAAYLVERAALDAFKGEVAALERAHPRLTLVCTGPWPPYSFAASTEVAA